MIFCSSQAEMCCLLFLGVDQIFPVDRHPLTKYFSISLGPTYLPDLFAKHCLLYVFPTDAAINFLSYPLVLLIIFVPLTFLFWVAAFASVP
jgi:hypothetical protein